MFNVLAFLILFAFSGEKGTAGTNERASDFDQFDIVNGNDIDISEAPYQASLHINSHFVGAAVIVGRRHLVTLASLGRKYLDLAGNNTNAVVVCGSNRTDEGVIRFIKKVVIHPKYVCQNNDYNVAILELTKHLKFNKKIQPIQLMANPPRMGEIGLVTGWGMTGPDAAMSKTLKSTEASFTSWNYCSNIYSHLRWNLTARMICTYKCGGTVCNGDQGGAIVVGKSLAGIVSDWFFCGKTIPDVYTSVTNEEIKQFIKAHVKLN